MNVWFNENVSVDRAVALIDSTLLISTPDKEIIQEYASKFEGVMEESDLEKVFNSRTKAFPFDSIRKIESDQHTKKIKMQYDSGNKVTDYSFSMASEGERDSFFEAIQNSNAPFDYSVKEYNALTASLAPLGFTVLTGAFTWLLFTMAQELANGQGVSISGRRNAFYKMLLVRAADILGTTGSLILGAVLLLFVLRFWYQSVKTPPIMMTLKKQK